MICLRVAFSSCIWHYSLSCCLRNDKKVHLHLLLVLTPHLSILLINSILLTLLSLRAQTQSAIAQQRSSSETADDLHDDCWFDNFDEAYAADPDFADDDEKTADFTFVAG